MTDKDRISLLAEVIADYREVNKQYERALTEKQKEIIDLSSENERLKGVVQGFKNKVESISQVAEAVFPNR